MAITASNIKDKINESYENFVAQNKLTGHLSHATVKGLLNNLIISVKNSVDCVFLLNDGTDQTYDQVDDTNFSDGVVNSLFDDKNNASQSNTNVKLLLGNSENDTVTLDVINEFKMINKRISSIETLI